MLSSAAGTLLLIVGVTSDVLRLHLKPHRGMSSDLRLDSKEFLKAYGSKYYGMIGLGNPRQNFLVSFDTAFAGIWVQSSRCPTSEEACAYHAAYFSTKSNTYIPNGKEVSFRYSIGSGEGILSTDTLHVAGIKLDDTFIEATSLTANLGTRRYDGVFGLGFNYSTTEKFVPPFYKMYDEGLVESPIYSFYITKEGDMDRGEIIFGGIDPRYFQGYINYVPVLRHTYWMFIMEGIALGPVSYWEPPCRATVITGTSLIMGPKDKIDGIMKQLNARWQSSLGVHTVECASVSSLPPLLFKINGVVYTLEATDYVIQSTIRDSELCSIAIREISFGDDPKLWVLGEIFIKKYYTVFDITEGRVGFAEAIPGVESHSSPVAEHRFFFIVPLIFLFVHRFQSR